MNTLATEENGQKLADQLPTLYPSAGTTKCHQLKSPPEHMPFYTNIFASEEEELDSTAQTTISLELDGMMSPHQSKYSPHVDLALDQLYAHQEDQQLSPDGEELPRLDAFYSMNTLTIEENGENYVIHLTTLEELDGTIKFPPLKLEETPEQFSII
jgi:hypothetical protein